MVLIIKVYKSASCKDVGPCISNLFSIGNAAFLKRRVRSLCRRGGDLQAGGVVRQGRRGALQPGGHLRGHHPGARARHGDLQEGTEHTQVHYLTLFVLTLSNWTFV